MEDHYQDYSTTSHEHGAYEGENGAHYGDANYDGHRDVLDQHDDEGQQGEDEPPKPTKHHHRRINIRIATEEYDDDDELPNEDTHYLNKYGRYMLCHIEELYDEESDIERWDRSSDEEEGDGDEEDEHDVEDDTAQECETEGLEDGHDQEYHERRQGDEDKPFEEAHEGETEANVHEHDEQGGDEQHGFASHHDYYDPEDRDQEQHYCEEQMPCDESGYENEDGVGDSWEGQDDGNETEHEIHAEYRAEWNHSEPYSGEGENHPYDDHGYPEEQHGGGEQWHHHYDPEEEYNHDLGLEMGHEHEHNLDEAHHRIHDLERQYHHN